MVSSATLIQTTSVRYINNGEILSQEEFMKLLEDSMSSLVQISTEQQQELGELISNQETVSERREREITLETARNALASCTKQEWGIAASNLVNKLYLAGKAIENKDKVLEILYLESQRKGIEIEALKETVAKLNLALAESNKQAAEEHKKAQEARMALARNKMKEIPPSKGHEIMMEYLRKKKK
jgi:hypothetical protein